MNKAKLYNITPAKGQALLNFQGRIYPDKIEIFETDIIEEVRKTKEEASFDKTMDLNPDFQNLLIQGDCLSACAYLKSKNIKVDLVYIDPPFASGANYAKKVYLRNGRKSEVEADDNSIGEEIMYGDIWQKEDYLNWLYERLLSIKSIMSETGSIYVHLDWHIGHYVKILMDEIFGEENFINEIIWHYKRWGSNTEKFQLMHDAIFLYSKNSEDKIFNKIYQSYANEKWIENTVRVVKNGKLVRLKDENGNYVKRKTENKGVIAHDVWEDINFIAPTANERTDYVTQKPEALLERIIKASSDEGMIVADFFSGSGTTAKVANNLNRKFIACDIGINAIQTTRDRLVKSGANFDILKIKDGLRLFRNPVQTTAKIFSIINGFKTRTDLDLNEFWDGGIAQNNGAYKPIKFSGINNKLTKELLDIYLEEIYRLEDTTDEASEIIIIYAHKDLEIDQQYLNKTISKIGKTNLKVKLIPLDELLGKKQDALFSSDNANIELSKQGDKYKVEIKHFFSSYLKNKIDEYNAKKVKNDLNKEIKISDSGLELIEAIQFDTTLEEIWKSNPDLEDRAGIKEKIKGSYILDTNKFKIKIRNIAGDEIIINSEAL